MTDKSKPPEPCAGCGATLDLPLVSISHTILPDARLCPACGQRESTDPAWAEGLRVGYARDAAARKGIK